MEVSSLKPLACDSRGWPFRVSSSHGICPVQFTSHVSFASYGKGVWFPCHIEETFIFALRCYRRKLFRLLYFSLHLSINGR